MTTTASLANSRATDFWQEDGSLWCHVNPGDIGTRFQLLTNRYIRPAHVKDLAKIMPVLHGSCINLIDVDGQLYIADGQHRITAASNTEGCSFRVVLQTEHQVIKQHGSVASYILGLNSGKPPSSNDFFAIKSAESAWPAAATKASITMSHSQASRTAMSASAVIQGFTIYMQLRKVSTVAAQGGGKSESCDAWVGDLPPEAHAYLAALAAYNVIAEGATKDGWRIWFGAIAMGVGASILEENRHSPALPMIVQRLSYVSPVRMKDFGAVLKGRKPEEIAVAMIEIFNQGAKTQLFTWRGEAHRCAR